MRAAVLALGIALAGAAVPAEAEVDLRTPGLPLERDNERKIWTGRAASRRWPTTGIKEPQIM